MNLWVYPGVSFGGSLTVADGQGNVLLVQELGYSTCFSWSENRLPVTAGQTLTVTVENAQVFEMAFPGRGRQPGAGYRGRCPL